MVRPAGGGRGDPVGQDRWVPRGLPLLLAVVRLRHPGEGDALPRHRRGAGGGRGDRRARRVGVLHRARGPGPRRADDAARPRAGAAGARAHRAQRRGERGHPHRGPGAALRRRGRAPLQPQPGDRPVVLRPDRHHPLLGGAGGHLRTGAPARHGAVLRGAAGDGGDAPRSASSCCSSCGRSTRPRCRSTSSTPDRARRWATGRSPSRSRRSGGSRCAAWRCPG